MGREPTWRGFWNRIAARSLVASVLLVLLGFVTAFGGLVVGFRGHSGDSRTFQKRMTLGTVMKVGSMQAAPIAVLSGIRDWRRNGRLRWFVIALCVAVPKVLLLFGLAISSR